MNVAIHKSAEPWEMRSGDIQAACKRYGIGRANIMKCANEAGAVMRIGKLIRINFALLDKYFDEISGEYY